MYPVLHVLPMHNDLGEGPLWHVAQQALYWVDFLNARFFRFVPQTGDLHQYQLDAQPGSLAFTDSGDILLATTRGLGLWRDGEFTLIDNDLCPPPNRLNDGAADRAGRFWVGTASDDPENFLYRVDHDGAVYPMVAGVGISNGIGWSPDNHTMYYSDSGGAGIVYAFDFELETGTLDNRRTFLPPSDTDVVADGLTVDAEGCLWIAFWNGWKVARYDPAGELITTITMPVQRPTSCAFGGPDLNELYVTSARLGEDDPAQPQSGDLFKIVTDVQGIAEPLVTFDLPDRAG